MYRCSICGSTHLSHNCNKHAVGLKTKVTVNGVPLTREQVEKAWKELNTPEPPPQKWIPKNDDHFYLSGLEGRRKFTRLNSMAEKWISNGGGLSSGSLVDEKFYIWAVTADSSVLHNFDVRTGKFYKGPTGE